MRLSIICHFVALILTSQCFAQQKVRTAAKSPLKTKEQIKVADKKKKSRLKKVSKAQRKLKGRYADYEVTHFPQYEIPPLLTREDLNKIIPSGVTATDPSDHVLKKMGDKAVNVWLKSPAMQQVSIVQTAQKVEDAMKAEVDLAPEDSDVKHKLNFQVQAFQTTSRVDYKGYVDATVSYNIRDQKAGYEVRQKIMHNKDFYVNHTTSKSEDLSSVGLKWGF